MNGYKQVIAGDRQSVIDLGVQEYGCYDGAFEIMKDNPALDLSLHSLLTPGVKVLIQVPVPRLTDTNQGVMESYTEKGIQVVGGGFNAFDEEDEPTITEVVIPKTFQPYVTGGYWIPGYVQQNQQQQNYAESINLNLETE